MQIFGYFTYHPRQSRLLWEERVAHLPAQCTLAPWSYTGSSAADHGWCMTALWRRRSHPGHSAQRSHHSRLLYKTPYNLGCGHFVDGAGVVSMWFLLSLNQSPPHGHPVVVHLGLQAGKARDQRQTQTETRKKKTKKGTIRQWQGFTVRQVLTLGENCLN